MAWNGLNSNSIIIPGQKLLLEVTPPATETPVPPPATPTPPPTITLAPSPTIISAAAQAPSPTATRAEPVAASPFASGQVTGVVILFVALAAGGLFVAGFFMRRRS
jgi:hypothetical protein